VRVWEREECGKRRAGGRQKRNTGRQKDRKTERKKDRKRERTRDREKDKERNREKEKEKATIFKERRDTGQVGAQEEKKRLHVRVCV